MELKTVAAAVLLLTYSLLARDFMRITLKDGSISDEYISEISSVIFENNHLAALNSYDLNNIEKIEFQSNGTSIINSDESKSAGIKKSPVLIRNVNNNLTIHIKQSDRIKSSLYSMNGRKITELFNGTASEELSFDLNKYSLGTGIYSVIAQSGNELYIQKIIQK